MAGEENTAIAAEAKKYRQARNDAEKEAAALKDRLRAIQEAKDARELADTYPEIPQDVFEKWCPYKSHAERMAWAERFTHRLYRIQDERSDEAARKAMGHIKGRSPMGQQPTGARLRPKNTLQALVNKHRRGV